MRSSGDFSNAFEVLARQLPDGLITIGDPLTLAHRMQIVDFAAEHRLPSIYGFRAFADVGGLMSYGPSLSDLWQRAAGYVDRILKGAKPSELAVEQPTRFEFIINMMAATALGITVPTTLLASADVLID